MRTQTSHYEISFRKQTHSRVFTWTYQARVKKQKTKSFSNITSCSSYFRILRSQIKNTRLPYSWWIERNGTQPHNLGSGGLSRKQSAWNTFCWHPAELRVCWYSIFYLCPLSSSTFTRSSAKCDFLNVSFYHTSVRICIGNFSSDIIPPDVATPNSIKIKVYVSISNTWKIWVSRALRPQIFWAQFCLTV